MKLNELYEVLDRLERQAEIDEANASVLMRKIEEVERRIEQLEHASFMHSKPSRKYNDGYELR